MEYKKVGKTGLKVSAIGIGSMTIGAQVSEADTIKIIDLAFERGINLNFNYLPNINDKCK